MAEALELQCPHCQTMLELDAGFAGGVCRCSSCNTLMTVPANPNVDRAEVLTRPTRPDSPDGAAVEADESDEAAYTTESGRVVHLGATKIPLALTKKKLVRATTAILFGGFVLLVLVAFIAAIIFLMSQKTADQTIAEQAAAFQFQRNLDPYTLDQANVLGLPLQGRTAVVVDADYRSGRWLDEINAALRYGLTRADTEHELILIYTAVEEPKLFSTDWKTPSSIHREVLETFHASVEAEGEPSITQAVELAILKDAAHIVMIMGHAINRDALDEIRDAVGDQTVVFDFVLIDKDDADLEEYAQETGGQYVPISRRLIGQWSP